MNAVINILNELGHAAEFVEFIHNVFILAYGEGTGPLPPSVRDEGHLYALVIRCILLNTLYITDNNKDHISGDHGAHHLACLLVLFADTPVDELGCLKKKDLDIILKSMPNKNKDKKSSSISSSSSRSNTHHKKTNVKSALQAIGSYVQQQSRRATLMPTPTQPGDVNATDAEDENTNKYMQRVRDICSKYSTSGTSLANATETCANSSLTYEQRYNGSTPPASHVLFIESLLREANAIHVQRKGNTVDAHVHANINAGASAGAGAQHKDKETDNGADYDEVPAMLANLVKQQTAFRKLPAMLTASLLEVKDEFESVCQALEQEQERRSILEQEQQRQEIDGLGDTASFRAVTERDAATGEAGISISIDDILDQTLSSQSKHTDITAMIKRVQKRRNLIMTTHEAGLLSIYKSYAASETMLREKIIHTRQNVYEEPFRKQIESTLLDRIAEVSSRCKEIRAKYTPIWSQARNELIKQYDAGRATVYGDVVFDRRLREEESARLHNSSTAPKGTSATDRVLMTMEGGIGNVATLLATTRIGLEVRERQRSSSMATSILTSQAINECKTIEPGSPVRSDNSNSNGNSVALPWPIVVEEDCQLLHKSLNEEDNSGNYHGSGSGGGKHVREFQVVSREISKHALGRLERVFQSEVEVEGGGKNGNGNVDITTTEEAETEAEAGATATSTSLLVAIDVGEEGEGTEEEDEDEAEWGVV